MIGLQEARHLLENAVATQGPSFVYNPDGTSDCYNIPVSDEDAKLEGLGPDHPKRKTGCLVGVALAASGVVPDMENRKADSVHGFRNYLEPEALQYFNVAQEAQDLGSTWGEAFRRAEAWHYGYHFAKTGESGVEL